MPDNRIEYINIADITYKVTDAEAERTENKIMSFPADTSSMTNSPYPTAKLVKESLDAKLNSSAVVTEFPALEAQTSDSKVPSEKLVYNALQLLQEDFGDAIDDLDIDAKEDVSNKSTAFPADNENLSDTKYPSEKLVKESLDNKLDVSDVVTSLSGAMSNDVYPTALAVTTAIGEVETVVVDTLPAIESAKVGVNYILRSGDAGLLYKKDRNEWRLIGGSKVRVSATLPQSGDVFTDYYVPADNSGEKYQHYRWMDTDEITGVAGHFYAVGSNSPAEVVSELPQSGDESTDYYVPVNDTNPNTAYLHYRWMDTYEDNGTEVPGHFYMIGSDAYSKVEIDNILGVNGSRLTTIESGISTNAGNITTLGAQITGLGNMVEDVTAGATGIVVSYKDGTTKNVPTVDATRTVESIVKSSTGLTITYTDDSTDTIEISGGGGGGGASSGTASITRVTPASQTCIYGDAFNIEYIFAALDSANDVVGSGSAVWYVNNIQKKANETAAQGVTNSFNIGPYLSQGSNNVRLTVTVDTGGDSPITVSKTWTINAVNMYVEWNYDERTVNTADQISIMWTPYGNITKTTCIVIDGDTENMITDVSTRSGVQRYVTIDKLSHGSHLVEIYCTATVNGTVITSESVFHDMIFADAGSSVPVIACAIQTKTITQYNTISLPITIYSPDRLTSNAELRVDGTLVGTWTNVGRETQYWNYTPSESGIKVLTITSGGVTKTITLTVTELDIDNEEISGYAFRLKASELNGNDSLRAWSSNAVTATFSENFDWDNGGVKSEMVDGSVRQYICVKAGTTMTINYKLFGAEARTTGKNIKIIFKVTNSRDYNAVWMDCMSGGIGIEFGANGGTASSQNNSVDFEYAEESYTEFEFDVRPQSEFRYMQTYIDGVLSSTNIYGVSEDSFAQSLKKDIVIGSADCDVNIYLVKVYETYLTADNHMANFIADAPNAAEMVSRYVRNDVLGDNGEISYTKLAEKCPDCRIHLWDIPRMTQNKASKGGAVTGCSYQQIYGAGTAADQLTASNVTISVQGTSSVNYISSAANTDGDFTDGFTDGNGNHLSGYAMTEDSIPISYFNTKVNVASCENANNMCLAEWYNRFQPYKSGARANIENARDCMEHHMGVQFIRDRHQDNEPQEAALFMEDDPNGENYHMYAICNMGNSKNNGTVFHDTSNPKECCIETKDNNSAYCMMTAELNAANFSNEEDSYFEFRYPASPTSEMFAAFRTFCNWMCSCNPAGATNQPLGASETFDAYTFKGTGTYDLTSYEGENILYGYGLPAAAGYAAVEHSGDYYVDYGTDYIYSCDGTIWDYEETLVWTADAGNVLRGLTISDYAGTYVVDSYEYRMAKMLSECEEHMIMDSIVYHYVFIEQHAMVDNVCKNTFWGTDDLVHWHLCKNYDNDTADGNDNVGKLTIPFGAEGMDTVSGRDVFNGNQSVYWQFVYGLYPARRSMWVSREALQAWNAEAYLAYVKSQQDCLPERVYNQDFWYKYLRPYEEKSDLTYIAMLQGGKKSHQRERFVRNNLTYMASQYVGTYCTSNSITMRSYTPRESENLTVQENAVIRATLAAVPPASSFSVTLYNKGYIIVQVASATQRIKANKGETKVVSFEKSQNDNLQETVINIHGAANVQAVSGLAGLYLGWANFSNATKLKELKIGSAVSGYCNQNIRADSAIGFGGNTLLEKLEIQNCPNSAFSLDLTNCRSLKELDISGSGFTGVAFAVNGLVEKAYLCALRTLSMRNLAMLTDEYLTFDSYSNLQTLRVENCGGIDTLNLVNTITLWDGETENGTGLRTVRLLGVDWTLTSTDLLDAMLGLTGLDEDGVLTDTSVLGGSAYIDGELRQVQLVEYNEAWNSLDISYDEYQFTPMYAVTYQNYDGTTLDVIYYERGEYPLDPVAVGRIATPVKPSDEDYDYTYSGWTPSLNSRVTSDKTYTATYAQSLKQYTVNWYLNQSTTEPLATLSVSKGSEAVYPNEVLPKDISEEQTNQRYKLFKGWDKSTACVLSDMNVYGEWETAAMPTIGTDLSEMTAAQVYAVCEENAASSYFEMKDHIDIVLGNDFEYSNVSSQVVAQNEFFDSDYVIDTDIRPFSYGKCTIAVDYETLYDSSLQNPLLFCVKNKSGNGDVLLSLGNSGSLRDRIVVGENTTQICSAGVRNIVVFRYDGSQTLRTYNFMAYAPTNVTSTTAERGLYTTALTVNSYSLPNNPTSDAAIYLGGMTYTYNGREYDGYTAKGWIHWCKVWYDDLGDSVCRLLAAWPHQTLRMEYVGSGRHTMSGTTGVPCRATFLSNSTLWHHGATTNSANGYMKSISSSYSWQGSDLQTFYRNRVYNAFPYVWKSAFAKVVVKTGSTANGNATTSDDEYVYAPAQIDVVPQTFVWGESLASEVEGGTISFYNTNSYTTSYVPRTKFSGYAVEDRSSAAGRRYFYSSDDPTISRTCFEGDLWLRTSNSSTNALYVYVPNSYADQHDLLGNKTIKGTNCIRSSDENGYWVIADLWHTRSLYRDTTDSNHRYRIIYYNYNSSSSTTTPEGGYAVMFSM